MERRITTQIYLIGNYK